MKSKVFKISIIAIIVILTTTFIFINKNNSNKGNLLKDSTNKIESKEKVKQENVQEKTENQKELPKKKNESVDVVESPKEEIKENKVSSKTSTTSTTSNNSNEIKQNNNQQNQSQSNNNNNQIKEEPVKENNNSYIGVPNPNDFNYSFHKGKIEYSSMYDCLSASERISLKDTVDIINSWCMDVVDGQGTVLGEYLYINCSSGNCNKYKD